MEAYGKNAVFTLPFSFLSLPASQLMASWSWFTLHNCEIYYLSAVNYDPATTYFSSRSIFAQGRGGGGLTANSLTHLFYQGHYLTFVLTTQ
jgi:hypothetical protein